MDKNNLQINIAFICKFSDEWIAGMNYLYNLLYAISSLESKKIRPVLFLGKKTDTKIKKLFSPLVEIVEDSMFDGKSLKGFIFKILEKCFNSYYFLEILLSKYNIQVVSHSNLTNIKKCKTVNWIPDFQHVHLPEMFSAKEIRCRNVFFEKLIRLSDLIVVSSQDALNDFEKFSPENANKARVLRFVAKPIDRYYDLTDKDKAILLKRYNLPEKFFYLPNQFWKHKNHLIVFEALQILNQQGRKINVVCTGKMFDNRNHEHFDNLKRYIEQNNLKDQVHLLGLIDYEDVYALIRFSQAVINPSLFEGWSSTVEECKSVNKMMILSDLPVHKEQFPAALFFKRDCAEELAKLIDSFEDLTDRNNLFDWREQSNQFAKTYEQIISELF